MRGERPLGKQGRTESLGRRVLPERHLHSCALRLYFTMRPLQLKRCPPCLLRSRARELGRPRETRVIPGRPLSTQTSSYYFAKHGELLSLMRITDLFLIYIKAQVENWTMQRIYYFTLLFILV